MTKKITPENALKKLDKQLKCPLCLDPFKEPKLLPCFHVFCRSPCLEKLIARDGQSLQCPICRHIVPLPAKGVSGLQSDFHIAHLFDIQEVFKKVDQSSGKKCELCEEYPTTGYCHDCEQFACDNCQIAHNGIKKLRNHKFITLDQLLTDTINFVPPKKAIPRCPEHTNKELEIYCETCRELICNDCTVHLHKDHNHDLVGEVFAKHKKEIVSGLRPVREMLDTIQQTLRAFASRTREINEQRFTVEANIHKEFNELQRLLDQRRGQLVGTLDMLTQQKLKCQAAQTDHVENIQAKLASCLEYAEGGIKTGTEEEVLTMKYPVLTRIEQINAEIDPHTIQSETRADLQLATDGKEQLQTACQQFVEIVIGCISPENTFIDDDTLERVIEVGEQKPVEYPVLTRIEKSNEEFNPDTIQPETMADLRLATDGKEQLETACQQFVEIVIDCISPENCFIDEDTLERVVKVGQQKSVEFHARTKTNKQFTMNLDLTAELIHTKSKNRLRCEVLKLENGAHKINYQPISRGKHELHITLDGSHVRGSPCLINVIPSSQSLNRPVRTVEDLPGPKAIAINSRGQIVAMKTQVKFISILTAEGEKIKTFCTRGSGNAQLSNPWGVTVDRDDNIYVADCGNHRVQKFNSEGKFVATVGSNGSNHLQFNSPIGICFHNKTNSLYVCDKGNHRIQVFSTDLKFKSSFGTRGGGNGQFQSPHSIALDDTNNLYVTDHSNHRVQVFTAEGQFLRAFTNKTNGEKLNRPCAIAIDSSNTVYVSESGPRCVSVFNSKGEYITSFGKRGTKEGECKYVRGLAVGGNDSIIVSDHGNGRLQIF